MMEENIKIKLVRMSEIVIKVNSTFTALWPLQSVFELKAFPTIILEIFLFEICESFFSGAF